MPGYKQSNFNALLLQNLLKKLFYLFSPYKMKVKRISAIAPVTLAEGVTWLDISKEDDNMGYTTHEIRLEPGTSYTLKNKANHNYVFYCIEGSCTITLLSSNNQYSLPWKSVLAVPDGSTSEIKACGSGGRTRLLAFYIMSKPSPAQLQPICRSFEEMMGTSYDVAWGNGYSKRYLTKADGFGVTVTNTTINANTESFMEYRNHLELCYFYKGALNYIWDEKNQHVGIRQEKVEDGDGLVVILDQHDPHSAQILDLSAEGVCCFSPALEGNETHNVSGDGHSAY